MNVGAICNRLVPTASMSTSVVAAAQCMQGLDERILVVIDCGAGRRPALGIVTERELAAIIAREDDPSRLELKDIMRVDPGFVTDTAGVLETARWMHRNRLREAIVHDEAGRLAGVVTLDQLVERLAGEMIASAALPATDAPIEPRRRALH